MAKTGKWLIIRFSSIGDIVLTTPVIRCIKKTFPDIELHCATKEEYSFIYRQNPYVDKVLALKSGLGALIRELRKENYDRIIDLHNNQRSLLVKMLLWRPSSSFNKLNIKKWLLVNFRINRLPDVHIVDRYFGTVEKQGVRNDGLGLEFFLPSGSVMPDLPESHRDGYIAVVTGAKFATKKLPAEILGEVCRQIQYPVILLGGKEDAENAAIIEKRTGKMCLNLCGRCDLNTSAEVVKNAKIVLTNDTGLMHIAAAFGKKIISFWGNTVPAFGMYPYLRENDAGESVIMEVKGLACRPCSKIGYQKCPRKHFRCMNEIYPESIISNIRVILGN